MFYRSTAGCVLRSSTFGHYQQSYTRTKVRRVCTRAIEKNNKHYILYLVNDRENPTGNSGTRAPVVPGSQSIIDVPIYYNTKSRTFAAPHSWSASVRESSLVS